MSELSPKHLANAIKNYAQYTNQELETAAEWGNSIAREVLIVRKRTIDKQKSKVIGMLHDLAADADEGDSKLRDGSYLTDRVSEIIIEVGKWPEHGKV